MIIAIGSTNPVKINSVKNGLNQIVQSSEGIITFCYNVKSDVSDQPMSDKETKTGSINRAINAYEAHVLSTGESPNYSVGLEGGLSTSIDEDDCLECFAYVTIYNGKLIYSAKTATFVLPKVISNLVFSGLELGDADDKVFGSINSKQEGGTVGHLTKGVIDRTKYYEQAVILSFMPFLWPNFFP